MSIRRCPICNKIIAPRFPLHDCDPQKNFKLGDRVLCDGQFFKDGKDRHGIIIRKYRGGNRFRIKCDDKKYPILFDMSKIYLQYDV